ncbi:Alcohol sulfotransferase A [Cricetulus griseus]|uniref:Sulfotransferase n=1 Tax=Cricetulus griseus TaxID=10029 RepID=G3IHU6_CRIGR|nr:Alcohol sulfotransferase A [Cricetulus griseus]
MLLSLLPAMRMSSHGIRVPYGSWFEHTRGWLSMRKCENFLLLSYEDMKKDTRRTIEKICDFLGKKLEPDELDMVLHYSSFQAMKENKMSNYSLLKKEIVADGFVFLRKGLHEAIVIPFQQEVTWRMLQLLFLIVTKDNAHLVRDRFLVFRVGIEEDVQA